MMDYTRLLSHSVELPWTLTSNFRVKRGVKIFGHRNVYYYPPKGQYNSRGSSRSERTLLRDKLPKTSLSKKDPQSHLQLKWGFRS